MSLTLILKSDDGNTITEGGESGRRVHENIEMERTCGQEALGDTHLNHANVIIRLSNMAGEALDELFLRAK